ncbi:hypothetical protein AVEN_62205-1 [Araneus ventricosus]|uniref:Uncharacterized protein n=1 Tax=Araneus ventricosus TaxID=182803 RepID=A0A4Y2MA80_ARAVE|nr:hypothetical protein AVEN_62205-1 [Araneus ventricosus]
MVYLGKGRREDMFILAKELDLKPDSSMTVKKLRDLITNDTNYDEEFAKNLYTSILEERKAKQEEIEENRRQESLAELKRKDELERLCIESRTQLGSTATKTAHTR